ncbi:MAG: hypothetical protein HY082_00420 [Gammaproteobacteria bacterium]|nr:hypothetical protein [Gammaproteobacteria bacterium]
MNSNMRATVIAVAFCIGLGAGAAHVAAQPAEQVIKIAAKKFDYTPGSGHEDMTGTITVVE